MSVHPSPEEAKLQGVGPPEVGPISDGELNQLEAELLAVEKSGAPQAGRVFGVKSESALDSAPNITRSLSSKWNTIKTAADMTTIEPDVVMMKTRQLDASEATEAIKITVLRLGKLQGRVEVSFKTKEHTAKANEDFVPQQGNLVFESGESEKFLHIKVIESSGWEPIEDFFVHLLDVVDGNATLGWLDETQVFLIDDDPYPPNFQVNENDGGAQYNDPKAMNSLYWAFVKERLAHRWPKPRNTYMACAYLGFFSVAEAVMRGMLVDYCTERINNKTRSTWTSTLVTSGFDLQSGHDSWVFPVVLSSCYGLLLAYAYRCDRLQQDQRGNSGTRQDLRNFLVQKYLFLSESDHFDLPGHEFLNACVNQVEEAVNKGWFMLCVLTRAFSLIFFSLAYMVSKYAASQPQNLIFIFAVFGIMILSMVLVILWRSPRNRVLVQIRQDSEDAWIAYLENIITNWRLFKLYNLESK
jgi:hypothetical protein